MPIIIILYILTGCCVLGIEARKLVRIKRITFGIFGFSFFAIFCCIIPGLTLWEGDLSRCRNHSEWYAFITYCITLIACIMAYFGYSVGSSNKSRISHENRHILLSMNKDNNITLFATALLVVSVISLYLYSSGYGGIMQTMLKGGQIRASFIHSSNSYAFFKHLIPLSIIASLLIYTDIFIKRKTKLLFLKLILFILSFIISIIYITANDGRMLAGIYILLFIIIAIKYKFERSHTSLKKLLIITSIVCTCIFILIIESENIFNAFRGRESISSDNTALDVILTEFNFIYVSLYTSVTYILDYGSNYLIINDLVNGLFAWLPTSLKPMVLDDVWDYNTILINDGGYGQSPVNIVAQSFYDLGILGIIIIPFAYTLVMGKLDCYFKNNYSTIGLVFSTVLAFYMGKAMAYFSLYNLMMNIFFIVLSWYIYKLIVSRL